MSLVLRDYQNDTIEQARALIRRGVSSLLIQSPTGSGKTVLTAQMLKTATARNYRTWFCVHRRELVKQSVLTLTEAADMTVGIVAAGFPSDRTQRCQVCSIGTLRGRRKLLPDPNLIVWDECHHVAASSWAEIHEAYPNAVHIGLTATPERLDGTGLGKWFSKIVVGPSVAWLIKHGYLCEYRMFAPPPPDLSGVHMLAGDYNKRELAEVMNKSSVTGDVLAHYTKHAPGKRMVLFAWSIEASMMLAAQFQAAGIAAEHVDGDTDSARRDDVIERFKRGDVKVMTNVDLFGEGFDVPAMEAVALLRPTRSLAVYLQQVGRALRPYPGKDYAMILDHAGNCLRFGLPDDDRVWSLEARKRARGGDYAVPIRQCPRCFSVQAIAIERCKFCGFVFVAEARDIEQVDGELQEVDVKRLQREARLREQSGARTMEELIALAELRGYKKPEKWAEQIYKAREAKRAAREALHQARAGTLI